MTDIKTVGFIGIGNMGAPMAANLARGGYDVIAFDLDPARAAAFAQRYGARATGSLEELGQASDAIVTMLPTGLRCATPCSRCRTALLYRISGPVRSQST